MACRYRHDADILPPSRTRRGRPSGSVEATSVLWTFTVLPLTSSSANLAMFTNNNFLFDHYASTIRIVKRSFSSHRRKEAPNWYTNLEVTGRRGYWTEEFAGSPQPAPQPH
jgi:hypothetical protein